MTRPEHGGRGDDTIAIAAGPGDHAAIAAIITASFDDGWSAGSISEILSLPGSAAIVLRSGGGQGPMVGACLFRVAADEAEILSLAILAEWRRNGLGGILLDSCLSACREAGTVRVFLEVEEGNAPALALYRAHRFVIVGHRKNYYRRACGTADAVVMCYSC